MEISEAWNCCHLGILRDIHTNTLVVHRYKSHWCQIIELSGIFVDCSHTLLVIQNKDATYYTMFWHSIFIFLVSNIVYLRTLHYGRRKRQNFKWFFLFTLISCCCSLLRNFKLVCSILYHLWRQLSDVSGAT